MATALAMRGHRSHVVSNGGRLVTALTTAGCVHHRLAVGRKSLTAFFIVARLRALIEELAPDLVHVHSRMPAWLTHLALRGMVVRPRLVATVHGPYSVNAYSRIMTRADRVIAVSRFIRHYILDHYPDTDANRIEIIHHGISSEQFPRGYKASPAWLSTWMQDWPMLQGKRLITLPGRLASWKGQLQFVDIVHALRQVRPDIHGVVAGGSYRRRNRFLRALKRKIRARGMDRYISLIGSRDDLREVLSVSDVVLSISQPPEAFGLTTLEALSLGVPVVAYDHGGVREIMQRLLPEGLVTPMSIPAVRDQVLRFLQTRPEIQDTATLSLEKSLEKTLGLYRAVIRSPLQTSVAP